MRIGSLLGALFLLTTPAAAQNVRLGNSGALLFNIEGLISSAPAAFENIGIGGRWFLSEGLAIRGALGIRSDTDSTEFQDESQDNKESEYALEGGVEIVLARGKSGYLYSGGILQVGTFENNPDGDDNNNSRLDLSVAGLIGATYFVADSLSIGAEYRLGIQYTSPEEQGSEVTRSTTRIGTGTAGFHLGFWFK